MDVTIEAVSAVGKADIIVCTVIAALRTFGALITEAAASVVTPFLRQGKTSLSAVAPDFYTIGGTAAA